MNDTDAIAHADMVFQNKLGAAKPGEVVRMTLWKNGRIVKNYPETRKEAPIDPVDKERAESIGLKVLPQEEGVACIAEVDGMAVDQE